MNRTERRRLRPEVGFDRLESRELLNGHIPKVHHAHFSDYGLHAPQVIAGKINGTSSYTGDLTGNDTYNLSGKTTAGLATVTGTDSFSSTLASPNTYVDLYYAGNWEMDVDGSTVEIAYTGSGYSNGTTNAFLENLSGTAIGISGSLLGKSFKFSGVVTGPGGTPSSLPTSLAFKLTS